MGCQSKPSESQKTVAADPVINWSDFDIEWEALKTHQIKRGVDHMEVDKEWKSILSRQRNLGWQLDILERMVPGYEVPAIRSRRKKHAGQQACACRAFTSMASRAVPEPWTWEQTLDEFEAKGEKRTMVESELPSQTFHEEMDQFKTFVAIEPEGYNSVQEGE